MKLYTSSEPSQVKMFSVSLYCDRVHRIFSNGELLACRFEYNFAIHFWKKRWRLVLAREIPPMKMEELPE